ncbi:MAG: lamin tail domain-containing protein [Bacteroidales bacterium]|nr:lamin tail domain-containing protein [Bacteroidales bacterium]
MKNRLVIIFPLVVLLIIASCVKDLVFEGPATISNVAGSPAAPKSTESVTVTAKVTDLKGVTSVNLMYKISTASTFTSVAMTAGANFVYTGTIPVHPLNTAVQYYVEVTNQDGLKSKYPATAPTALATYTVGASTVISLFINEVFADGTKDATDPDWFEIYNNSEIPVNLTGYLVSDGGIYGTTKPKRVLGNLTIAAKGFLVISTEYNEETVQFGLSTSGDAIYLENPSGVLAASLDFGTIALAGKKSYGRKPDGSSTLLIFNNPTKGSSNNNAN